MNYPRVLIVTIGRINAADTSNNCLLLRNLFGAWPKDHLAQIYSSDNNGDEGFFGHYYQLGPQDRRFGSMFYRMKAEAQSQENAKTQGADSTTTRSGKTASIRSLVKRMLVDTGLYEMIFRPRLSPEMLAWVAEFQPDIIFAQGYNLAFTWLPVMLREATGSALAFLTTDDWPTYRYAGQLGEPTTFRWLLRSAVKNATHQLLANTDVPFAFGQPMADEYARRYKKNFITLSHADDPRRFEEAIPHRCHPDGIFTILVMGVFNRFRWPLLLNVNECCRLLNEQGINARVAVLSAGIDPNGIRELEQAEYIDIFEDPGNDRLPAYLKGADLLLLVEGFDKGFVSTIRFSVSSKAHLFMFSQRPIIVYSHCDTGVSKYASEFCWAYQVNEINTRKLMDAITLFIHEKEMIDLITTKSAETAKKFHTLEENQRKFLISLKKVSQTKKSR